MPFACFRRNSLNMSDHVAAFWFLQLIRHCVLHDIRTQIHGGLANCHTYLNSIVQFGMTALLPFAFNCRSWHFYGLTNILPAWESPLIGKTFTLMWFYILKLAVVLAFQEVA